MNKNILGGIIILVGISLLFAGVFLFRDGPLGGLTFKLQFAEAKGLKPGDSVYMRGVGIGEIRNLGFDNGQVVAEVKIYQDEGLHVPDDSYFFIWPHQLLTGKKCVIVAPGESAQSVARGALIQGESSPIAVALALGPKKLEEIVGLIREAWGG